MKLNKITKVEAHEKSDSNCLVGDWLKTSKTIKISKVYKSKHQTSLRNLDNNFMMSGISEKVKLVADAKRELLGLKTKRIKLQII